MARSISAVSRTLTGLTSTPSDGATGDQELAERLGLHATLRAFAPGGAVRSRSLGPGLLQSENGRTLTEISQREKNVAQLGKVLVLSASAGAGHLRAAQAVEHALIGMGAVRQVSHIDVLEYTNKLFRNFYSKAYIEMVNTMSDVLGWLYDYLDKPWKNERGRLAFDKLNTRPFVKHAPGHRRYGFRHPCDVARASFRALFRGLGRNTRASAATRHRN